MVKLKSKGELLEEMSPVRVRRETGHAYIAWLQNAQIVEHGKIAGAVGYGPSPEVAVSALFNDLTNLRSTQKLTVNAREYRWNGAAFIPV